jgi:hypothetical protein
MNAGPTLCEGLVKVCKVLYAIKAAGDARGFDHRIPISGQ